MSSGTTPEIFAVNNETVSRELPANLSIVIPCHNEEPVLDELTRRLQAVVDALPLRTEIILVDDRSTDDTWGKFLEIQASDPRYKLIRLSRNFGHQAALTSGLDQAKGDLILILDADLQDPPELLPKMLECWRDGFDVVYGKRISREGETLAKKVFAFAFYRTMQRITGLHIPADAGDFRLLDRKALVALNSLRERHRFIRGMVSWVGFKQTPVVYEREARFAGQTKYPFRKSLRLAFDAITSFSYVPLRLATYLGLGTSIFAFFYIILVIILKIMGVNFPGYTSIMASILFLGGAQLIVLGIIGEYVGRIFEQGQARPIYIVEEIRESDKRS
jgi:glycosyltransferase involved in cell wall biosynthesis